VQRPRRSQRGHLYFELVEKGERDEILGKLDAVIWRRDHQRIHSLLARSGQQLAEGQVIRCRANLDFYAPSGRLQLVVRDVDPVFTVGMLAQRRQRTLEALLAAGLLDRNQQRPLAPLPLRVGLITSRESAAYHDFLSGLRDSGFGFRVLFVHASVQGVEAERQVALALARLATAGLDCCVLIRGGGARTDLAAFDSRRIAERIALAPFPVLTGLGHEIDDTIADRVAHSEFKTPTKVAEFLVSRVAQAEASLNGLGRELAEKTRSRLREAHQGVRRCEQTLKVARHRLGGALQRLEELISILGRHARRRLREAELRRQDRCRRLVVTLPRQLARRGEEPRLVVRRLVDLARGRLREARATHKALSRLCHELSPHRTLERGFSLTRDRAGRVVTRVAQVEIGERITTELAAGRLRSRVEET
jgi:exodeoxyribonuclease VII large subunit